MLRLSATFPHGTCRLASVTGINLTAAAFRRLQGITGSPKINEGPELQFSASKLPVCHPLVLGVHEDRWQSRLAYVVAPS